MDTQTGTRKRGFFSAGVIQMLAALAGAGESHEAYSAISPHHRRHRWARRKPVSTHNRPAKGSAEHLYRLGKHKAKLARRAERHKACLAGQQRITQ